MHMADALLSPVVSGSMLIATAATATYSYKKIAKNIEDTKIPLMGVMGAFVFAAQMINFTIPGTGSSGHIGGGMLLAILLGPYAGFLTMGAVLLIQALFFGDGGLMAYGANVMNLGFFTCFIAYPLIYKPLMEKTFLKANASKWKRHAITIGAVAVGLQMGAFSVVLETVLSGKTELPFGGFVLLMQPIHLAIGLVEGFITAAVVAFVQREKPELLTASPAPAKGILIAMLVVTLVVGGGLSLYASSHPDGLEWSIEKMTGSGELESEGGVFAFFASVQEKTAFMPDYDFKSGEGFVSGTTVAGIVGAGLTLLFTVGLAIFIKKTRGNRAIRE